MPVVATGKGINDWNGRGVRPSVEGMRRTAFSKVVRMECILMMESWNSALVLSYILDWRRMVRAAGDELGFLPRFRIHHLPFLLSTELLNPRYILRTVKRCTNSHVESETSPSNRISNAIKRSNLGVTFSVCCRDQTAS